MQRDDTSKAVSVLVTVWHEDDVWNFSAIDLPIVAYGDSVDAARSNFQEALTSHVQALAHFGELERTEGELRSLTSDGHYYEVRIQPGTMVERFLLPQVETLTRAA